MHRQNTMTTRGAGFTLMEMLIVMTVVGVIAGVLTPFIVQAVRAYQALEARNELVAKGRLALERMAREVRHAIPNSLELVSDAAGNPGIQFVASRHGTRYIDSSDNLGAAFSDFSRRFQVATNLSNGLYIIDNGLTQTAGHLIIGNTAPANLKSGCGGACSSVAITGLSPTTVAGDGTDKGRIVQFATHSFPYESPGRHAFITGDTHEVGLSADGTLRWHRGDLNDYDGDGDWSGSDPILVGGVDQIAFAYQPGTAQSSAVLSIDLSLIAGEESIRLYQEIHVRNTP